MNQRENFEGYINLYTTDAPLMMDWYKKVFGYHFQKGQYDVNTVVPLYYYYAPVPLNTPWKILKFKGIMLHPSYDDSLTHITLNSYLGFEWVDYGKGLREPIYKFEYYIQNAATLLSNIRNLKLNIVDKSHPGDDYLLYREYFTKYQITDPRENTITLWDIDNCYRQNRITQKKTPIPNPFRIHMG
jgi:hypothetical protein